MGDLLNRGTKDRPRWYCRYVDTDGRRKQRRTGQTSKAAALSFLAEIEARIRRGQIGIVEPDPEARARKAITVRELARRFLGEVEGVAGYGPPRIKSIASYRRDVRSAFNRLPEAIASAPAAAVTTRDVEAVRDALLARGLAPATAVQTLAYVSKAYNWARKVGIVDCANPVQGVERPRPTSSLDYLAKDATGRLLAEAEGQAVAEGAPYEVRLRWPMVVVAIFAGLRKGELFGLRWQDVALDDGRLDVLRSYRTVPKSGKPRHVPMHPEIARALRWWRDRCPATPEALAFPVARQRATTAKRAAPDAAAWGALRMGRKSDEIGIGALLTSASCHAPADGHPWHMLRHTFASHFVMAGGSLLTLQRLLGHSTPAMTMRYAHLAPDYLAAEVARLTFAAPPPAGMADLGEERRRRALDAMDH